MLRSVSSGVPKVIQQYTNQLQQYAPSNQYSQQMNTPQYGATQQPGISPNATSGYSLNNDYAVGSRTYNGSSPSPQAGPGSVNPAGYATRDNMAQTRNQLLAGYANQAGM